MKISGSKIKLQELLQVAFIFTAARKDSVYQYVKCVARHSSVTFAAGDREVSVVVETDELRVHETGECLIDRRILQTLAETDKAIVEVSAEGDRSFAVNTGIRLHCDYSAPQLPTPATRVEVGGRFHLIGREDLASAIARTVYATTETDRFAFSGVRFECFFDHVNFVATDGRRLSWQRTNAKSENWEHSTSAVVPEAGLKRLLSILSKSDADEIKFAITTNYFLATIGNVSVSFRLVEGRYPNWRTVIPTDSELPHRFDVPVADLASAIRQCAIMTDAEHMGIKLTAETGSMVLESQLTEVGSARISRQLDYQGPPLEVTLAHHFVTDVCKTIGDQTLSLFFGSDAKIKLTSESGFTGVIMGLGT